MKINTNVSSITAQRNLSETGQKISVSSARLASGYRVNSASDDAAALSISNKLDANIRSRQTASRNAVDGISALQVANGAVDGIHRQLIRMRELAMQASNGTYQDKERQTIDYEVQQIKLEIDRISKSTNYNSGPLLNGNDKQFSIVVDKGAGSNDTINIRLDKLAQDSYALGIFDVRVDSQMRAQFALEKIDYAIDQVSVSLADIGANSNRLQNAINNLQTTNLNSQAAKSQIKDTDYADETATMVKEKVKSNAATNVLAQANNLGKTALRLIE
jgi:flagellin